MKIFLDTANVNEIKSCLDNYEIDGVTTNPSIITKENLDFVTLMNEISSILGDAKTLFIQVIATDYNGIVEDTKTIFNSINGNISVKIPVTREGFKAMKYLSRNGYSVAATSIITSQQGLMAAKCGAKFLIPYVNRIDNIMGDGVNVVKELMDIITMYGYNTEVIAASFKNVQQIHNCALNGVNGVTTSTELLEKILEHSLTNWSVEQFTKDWSYANNNEDSIAKTIKKV
ncbi:MAG: transaldolase family protein [Eubacteriaceae bacterium]